MVEFFILLWSALIGLFRSRARLDPGHEPGQPSLGCAADPWRTPQTRHRYWANHGRQVYDEGTTTAVPGLEDVPAQSCRWHRVDGFIRGSDDLIPFVVWAWDPATS